jgi:hypothetical protein
MKLIKELCEHVEPLVLTEGAEGGKTHYITGPFLQAEVKNRNGRVYPLQILQRECARYNKELVNEGRALGELGHPENPTINLDRVSHKIVELRQDGSNFMGKAKVMDTPNGRIVKTLIDEGVRLGVSSRGLGSLKEAPEGHHVVGEDFYLSTAADIVADPSAPNAFVEGIMEGREWVWQNGILTEREIAQLKTTIAAAPVKKAAERRLVESRAFEQFLRAIRVDVVRQKR